MADKEGGEFRPGQAYLVGGNTKVFGAALYDYDKKTLRKSFMRACVSRLAIATRTWNLLSGGERLYFCARRTWQDPTEPRPPARTLIRSYHRNRAWWKCSTNSKDGLKTLSLPIGVQRFEDDCATSCIRCNTCDGFPCMVNAKGSRTECLIHALAHSNVNAFNQC